MWESIEVPVGAATYRGRFRVEGRQLILEWAGGRTSEWLGVLKPELAAAMLLKKLAARRAVAA